MQRSQAGSPPITPPPGTHQSSNRRRDRSRHRGYSLPREKSRRREISLLLCVFHSSSHNWTTKPIKFDPNRINDRELWEDIRDTFRMDMQKPWRRIIGFKKVKSIVPIGVRHRPYAIPIFVHTEHTELESFSIHQMASQNALIPKIFRNRKHSCMHIITQTISGPVVSITFFLSTIP